jgi:hypothetical protein
VILEKSVTSGRTVTYKVRYFNYLNLVILRITQSSSVLRENHLEYTQVCWGMFIANSISTASLKAKTEFCLLRRACSRYCHCQIHFHLSEKQYFVIAIINNFFVITFSLYYVLESSSNNSILSEIRASIAFVILLPISWIMFPFVEAWFLWTTWINF